MRLDIVHIIEQLGIDSAKFDEWKIAVLGDSEAQQLDQTIPPEADDTGQASERRK